MSPQLQQLQVRHVVRYQKSANAHLSLDRSSQALSKTLSIAACGHGHAVEVPAERRGTMGSSRCHASVMHMMCRHLHVVAVERFLLLNTTASSGKYMVSAGVSVHHRLVQRRALTGRCEQLSINVCINASFIQAHAFIKTVASHVFAAAEVWPAVSAVRQTKYRTWCSQPQSLQAPAQTWLRRRASSPPRWRRRCTRVPPPYAPLSLCGAGAGHLPRSMRCKYLSGCACSGSPSPQYVLQHMSRPASAS